MILLNFTHTHLLVRLHKVHAGESEWLLREAFAIVLVSHLHHGLYFSAGSIHKAYAGESERLLREAFAKSSSKALFSGIPVVIFIDEIDALCPRRDSRCRKQPSIFSLFNDHNHIYEWEREIILIQLNIIALDNNESYHFLY